MKVPQSVKVKDTVSLYLNKYQYKIVLVCPIANWFREYDVDTVSAKLDDVRKGGRMPLWLKFKHVDDQQYCIDVCKILKNYADYGVRVEHPILNIYTNDQSQIENLAKIDADRIKYVCVPNKNHPSLKENTIIVKKLDYDFKIFVGKTRKSYPEFLGWCSKNKNLRLTSRIKSDLSSNHSYGGGYFYVRGENTLTMVKMFIGGEISRIEQIIKA